MPQRKIETYESDLENLMKAAALFTQVRSRTLPSDSTAITAYDTFHKVHEPMLRNYQEVPFVREILENFESELKRNYPGQY